MRGQLGEEKSRGGQRGGTNADEQKMKEKEGTGAEEERNFLCPTNKGGRSRKIERRRNDHQNLNERIWREGAGGKNCQASKFPP